MLESYMRMIEALPFVLSQSFQSCDPFYDAECRMLSKRCRPGQGFASGSRTPT
jgi:hypothetical protein